MKKIIGILLAMLIAAPFALAATETTYGAMYYRSDESPVKMGFITIVDEKMTEAVVCTDADATSGFILTPSVQKAKDMLDNWVVSEFGSAPNFFGCRRMRV